MFMGDFSVGRSVTATLFAHSGWGSKAQGHSSLWSWGSDLDSSDLTLAFISLHPLRNPLDLGSCLEQREVSFGNAQHFGINNAMWNKGLKISPFACHLDGITSKL